MFDPSIMIGRCWCWLRLKHDSEAKADPATNFTATMTPASLWNMQAKDTDIILD